MKNNHTIPGKTIACGCAAFLFLWTEAALSSDLFGKEWLSVSNRRKMGLLHEARRPPFTCYATSPKTAARGLEVAHGAYARAIAALGTKDAINRSIVLCIWDKEDDYEKYAAKYYISARGAFAFAQRDVLPNTDGIFGYVHHEFFNETLPHEVAHIVLYNLFDPTADTRLPSWIHEGFAQLMENNLERSKEKARLRIMKGIEDNEFLPIWQLTAPRKPHAAPGIFYGEALLFVDFLIENQRKKGLFWKLCDYVANNPDREFEYYFKSYYPQFNNVKEINGAWKKWIMKNAVASARGKLRSAGKLIYEGNKLAKSGDTRGARKRLREAFHDLYILEYDYTKLKTTMFNRQKAVKLIASCTTAYRRLVNNFTTVKVLPGALLQGRSKWGNNKGVNLREGLTVSFDEHGTPDEVRLTKPDAGKVGGIAVGDDLEELLIRYGRFEPSFLSSAKEAFLSVARSVLPGAAMDCFERGSYPLVAAPNTFKGLLIRSAVDMKKEQWSRGNWFFATPMIGDTAVVCVGVDERNKISEIRLYPSVRAKYLMEESIKKGSEGILPRNPKITLKIGERVKKLISCLGCPHESKEYSIQEISSKGTFSRGRRRYRIKLKDDTGLVEYDYPGLEAILWDGYIVSLWVRRPSRAAIYGVRVGDGIEKVTRVMGITDALMKYEKKKAAQKIDKKEKYDPLVLVYDRGKARISFRFDCRKEVSSIYARATEWRGKRWGDTYYID